MVSNKFARKSRVILERVLESSDPTEQDLIWLCGGQGKYHFFMMKKEDLWRDGPFVEIGRQLTPDNWREIGVRNYGSDASDWERTVLPKLRKKYQARHSQIN